MKVSLVVADGPNRGRSIAIRDASFLIGRDPGCQLRANSESISRKHCEIVVSDAEVAIRDLGSMNGTLVNGEPIQEVVSFKNGDVLQVGPLRFLVRIVDSPPSEVNQSTKLMGADGTLADGAAPPQPSGEVIRLNAAGGDTGSHILAGPTHEEEAIPSSGPPTSPVSPQNPPVSSEGVSKAASDLIKKMMARSPRRPPGNTGPGKPRR